MPGGRTAGRPRARPTTLPAAGLAEHGRAARSGHRLRARPADLAAGGRRRCASSTVGAGDAPSPHRRADRRSARCRPLIAAATLPVRPPRRLARRRVRRRVRSGRGTRGRGAGGVRTRTRRQADRADRAEAAVGAVSVPGQPSQVVSIIAAHHGARRGPGDPAHVHGVHEDRRRAVAGPERDRHQRVPPNQVLVGLALFLSLFVMGPTFDSMQSQGVKPYLDGTKNVGSRPSPTESSRCAASCSKHTRAGGDRADDEGGERAAAEDP